MASTYLKTGIIIQARTGSTRLPGKMMMPFYCDTSLIALIIERIKQVIGTKMPVILATTQSTSDDGICKVANDNGIRCFRGSENDVLQRFIDAAKQYQISTIIRICADNPFLDMEGTLKLGEFWNAKMDYLSYQVKGNKPAILSHLGLWGEWVSLKSLTETMNTTKENVYHEHVTNYVYTHADQFAVELVNAPDRVFARNDVRLTVDTLADFELTRDMYSALMCKNCSLHPESIVTYLDQHPELIEKMKLQIVNNTK